MSRKKAKHRKHGKDSGCSPLLCKKDKTKMMPSIKNAVKTTDEGNRETDDDMKIVSDKKSSFESNLFPDEKTKPVVLSSNNEYDGNEFQEVPTIIARENLGKYLDGDSDDNANQSEFSEDIGIQMSFDGFDDKVEEVPTIDEEVAEKILIEQRKEKVDKFRLFGPDKTDSELGDEQYSKSDYNYEGQQASILASLMSKNREQRYKLFPPCFRNTYVHTDSTERKGRSAAVFIIVERFFVGRSFPADNHNGDELQHFYARL